MKMIKNNLNLMNSLTKLIKNKKTNFFILILFFAVHITALAGNGYAPGDKAADFSLKNTDGKIFSLSSMEKAKGFIIVFTCNHCPFSQAYEDRIISMNKKYASQGYPVIAINSNDPSIEPEDSYENMVKRSSEHQYNFPYLVDNTQEIAKKYGASRTPHIFVLSKQAKDLVVEYVGAIDDSAYEPDQVKTPYVELAVNDLLAGKKVGIPSTKAIGCSIKWKNK
jgi:peroxiredoxin